PLASDAATIRAADRVILPGVGAAAPGMARLRELGLVETLRALTQPVLGVCLGMQLLFDASDEGDTACLGVIGARVTRLAGAPGLRVPHMGWNALAHERDGALTNAFDDGDHAYFVHGYAAPSGPWTVASCAHGARFSAIVEQRNFHGMQFHPERSAAIGARLLERFLQL
ncbi:MAG TPA: imidazole glycerol phosphate synthase subunit HisH, partial [Tahibacter sp.]|nr:imidazole glycerol phosphate synthase subunit HisH [Tahibacter sp.]